MKKLGAGVSEYYLEEEKTQKKNKKACIFLFTSGSIGRWGCRLERQRGSAGDIQPDRNQ